jgi:hypothetical protein
MFEFQNKILILNGTQLPSSIQSANSVVPTSPPKLTPLGLILLNNLMNLFTLLILNNRYLSLLQREGHRILRPENLRQLFQSPILRLHEQEIDQSNLKAVPEDKQEVILPPSTRESNTRNKGVVKASNINPEVVESHSLSPTLVT